jgi:urease accessory protein
MRSTLICMALTARLVSPALAHNDVLQTNSFAPGITHPLNGADHILTMVTIGFWAVLAGGRAMWVWPSALVATMVAGFAAASLGLQMLLVEAGICLSAVILGLFVAIGAKTPLWLGAAIAGLFAFFHGPAHGTEVAAAGLIPYVAGFALATAGLHAAGIGLGFVNQRTMANAAVRAIGGLVSLGGVAFIAGLT